MNELESIPTVRLEQELIRRYKIELNDDLNRDWNNETYRVDAHNRIEDFDEKLLFLHGSIKAKREHQFTLRIWRFAAAVVPCWTYVFFDNIGTIISAVILHIITVFCACTASHFFPLIFGLNFYASRPSKKCMISIYATIVVVTVLFFLCAWIKR